MAEILKTIQKNKYEKEVRLLENAKLTKGKSAANFRLRDMVLGKKIQPQDPIVLIDPITKKQVVKAKEIKEVSLNYCLDLLTNKPPDVDYVDFVKSVNQLHDERMTEIIPNDLEEIRHEAFTKACKKIQDKSGKYIFFKKAGQSLYPALWNLFQTVWRTEKIPEQWKRSTIIQIEKSKSKIGDLEGIRHIHDKDEFFKFFGNIVVQCAKEQFF